MRRKMEKHSKTRTPTCVSTEAPIDVRIDPIGTHLEGFGDRGKTPAQHTQQQSYCETFKVSGGESLKQPVRIS